MKISQLYNMLAVLWRVAWLWALGVLLCSSLGLPCAAQEPPLANDFQDAIAATPTPTFTPTPTQTPLPTPTLQPLTQYQERMLGYEWWKSWLAIATFFAGVIIAALTFWRIWLYNKQVLEAELAAYRERLFSEDPSARVAAAMSLSKYPQEAIWLVNRFAREHELCNAIMNIEQMPMKREKSTRALCAPSTTRFM